MKIIRKIIGVLFVVLCFDVNCLGAYLTNIPIQITQPNGDTLTIYASGDEYYNWLHDTDGYTIVQNAEGYYVYAQYNENGDDIKASSYIVGKCNPYDVGLQPNITNRNKIIRSLMNQSGDNLIEENRNIRSYPTSGTINNIVIYIRFADQSEFTDPQTKYTNLFNNSATGANSVYNYFKEVSYNQLNVNSTFYPTNNGTTILSYQDIHTRSYYLPNTDPSAIDSGYNNYYTTREREVLTRAINYVKNSIPTTLNIDGDNDGEVDNICFIIRGNYCNIWNSFLWPRKGNLMGYVKINNKKVTHYNIQIENVINSMGVGVLCHEFCHSLGAPDLYHHSQDSCNPMGIWDIMSNETNPPQHMSSFIKYAYFNWISNIPEITQTGYYSLSPLQNSSNNCYKISLNGTNDYLILEYRKKDGTFENSLPNSGLLIYRIHPTTNGNPQGNQYGDGAAGNYNGIYAYRKGGSIITDGDITKAMFSANSGRTRFSSNSDPQAFLSDSSIANVLIKDVSIAGNTISFYAKFCDGDNIIYSNTNNLPQVTNASNSIATVGVVTIKNTDNILFEAKDTVTLDKNFSVDLGGSFEINMDGCFEH
ncbi:MAG: M6 family metalloprotease domain-containing protein [Bacteroidales bacterium]|nr:M6 family metalloprotease domain-containing protein [Bacteroidales bacterium]